MKSIKLVKNTVFFTFIAFLLIVNIFLDVDSPARPEPGE